jgi:hypothetical protein
MPAVHCLARLKMLRPLSVAMTKRKFCAIVSAASGARVGPSNAVVEVSVDTVTKAILSLKRLIEQPRCDKYGRRTDRGHRAILAVM